MDRDTRNLLEIGVAWCGPACIVGYSIFWAILGHNVPPPLFMNLSGEELIAQYYGKFQTSIAIGMAVSCIVGMLYMPWSCMLGSLMRNEDGELSVLSFMEFAGGILTGWVLAFCPAIWLACAVFVDVLEPSILLAMHGFTWFLFAMTFMVTTIQVTSLGLYTIFNKQQKVFPAWAGWAAIAVGIIFVPLVLIPFAPVGPFSVGGLWNFFIVFGTWLFAFFIPYSYFTLKELYSRREAVVARSGVGIAVGDQS